MFFYYPVSEEQVKILNLLHLSGDFYLWVLRVISLVVLIGALWFWYRLVIIIVDKYIAVFSIIFIFICPVFLVLAMIYPLMCIKLFLFSAVIYLILTKKYWWVVAVGLVLFNVYILGNHPAIFNKLSLKDAQTEVTHRISTEDSLKNDLKFPLWWRRISYNKYFFAYKEVMGEALPFFDFESIFFAEINPLAQKSVVIFYWPEMYLLVFSLYFIVRFKNNKVTQLLVTTVLLAWINFVFSEGSVFLRLILVIFPISLLLGIGFSKLPKWLAMIVAVFIVFGWGNSIYDLNVRTDYWLDNRSLAFQFWYKEIDNLGVNNFDKIRVSSLVGDAKQYCYFYLGKVCDDKKFEFNSFDLSKEKEKDVLYAGFCG